MGFFLHKMKRLKCNAFDVVFHHHEPFTPSHRRFHLVKSRTLGEGGFTTILTTNFLLPHDSPHPLRGYIRHPLLRGKGEPSLFSLRGRDDCVDTSIGKTGRGMEHAYLEHFGKSSIGLVPGFVCNYVQPYLKRTLLIP